MGHPTVGNRGASILGLKQIEVVGHGCWVAHDARVHSKAILVTWPRQLGKIKTQIDRSIHCAKGQGGTHILWIMDMHLISNSDQCQ